MANSGGSDIVSHFRTGLDVLQRYPAVIIAPLAVHVILWVLRLLFMGTAATAVAVGGVAGILGASLGALAFSLLSGILSLVAAGVTIIMARDALASRQPVMGDAAGVVVGRLADVLLSSIIVMVIVGIGMMLLVLPGIAAMFFLMFTLPAVLLDNLGAVAAIKRSAALVKDNLVPVLLFLIGCLVVGIAVWIVGLVLGFIPLIGRLALAVLFGVVIAYLSIVAVRVYQTLPVR